MWNETREERKEVFKDTKHLYETNEKLIEAVKASCAGQKVVLEGESIQGAESGCKFELPAQVIVSMKRSLEAAGKYASKHASKFVGQKVCVLNFASATHPGGGVVEGSSAQEEAICRCSTLYPCISQKKISSQFHEKHLKDLKAGRMNVLYNDDCIYTPGVAVFKTDTMHPALMEEKDWYNIDVITCAAPNLRSLPGNIMNPGGGNEAARINQAELQILHMKRMKRILDLAKSEGEEVLILGAFGCGAFENPPEIVASAWAEILKGYLHDFKTIEFAVYCPQWDPTNCEVFKEKLSGLTEDEK